MTNPCSSCSPLESTRKAMVGRKKKKTYPKNCYRKVSNPCQKLLLANKSFIDPHERRKKNGYDLFFPLSFASVRGFPSEYRKKKNCNICTYGTPRCVCCFFFLPHPLLCMCNGRCSIGWFFFYHLLSDKLGIHRLLKDFFFFLLPFDELKLNGGKWLFFSYPLRLKSVLDFFSLFFFS